MGRCTAAEPAVAGGVECRPVKTSVSRVRENRMHGSKGRGWKRAKVLRHVEMGTVGKPFGMSATAYGPHRASPLPDH